MKILLVGGAGFIGSLTALRLLEGGHEPVVMDTLDPQVHGLEPDASPTLSRLKGHVSVIPGDTRDRATLDACLHGVEAVAYFPAGTGTGQSMYQIERYTDINARGAAVFCEALGERRDMVRRVVVSSTRAVYGEGAAVCARHGRVFPGGRRAEALEAGDFSSRCPVCGTEVEPVASNEDDPSRPVSVYGITKLTQEQLIANTCATLDIPAVVFRYQNVFGPGQSLKNPYTGILSIFTQLLMAGRQVNLFEDGMPTRDFVYIEDVVEYNVRALTLSIGGVATLNVGSGARVTLAALVGSLARSLGVEARYTVSGQFRVGDIRHALADGRRLAATLGAHAFLGFDEGVKRFVDWVTETGACAGANESFDRSLVEMRAKGLLRG